jgi:hypothetical protein
MQDFQPRDDLDSLSNYLISCRVQEMMLRGAKSDEIYDTVIRLRREYAEIEQQNQNLESA